MQAKKLAEFIKNLAEDKKGVNPVILDIRKITDVAKYFVIVSGTSSPHVKAIAEHIARETKKKKVKPWHIERDREATWIVIDHADVITHVFQEEARKYYNLERLWGNPA